jgi:predicted nuclease of predicted toxin-antitoxin system
VRFFADECVDMRVVHALRSAGHEVLQPDFSDRGAADDSVLETALNNKAVLLTEDRDFGALIFRDLHDAVGVFYFRCDDPGRCTKAVLDTLDRVHGNLVVVTDRAIRVRPLKRSSPP